MGVTKSGPEHALMDRLWARGVNEPVAGLLAMPDNGLWAPKAATKVNRYSLNQDWCRASNWLLDAALSKTSLPAGFFARAISRAQDIHNIQHRFGHWCSGDNGQTEFGTGSHRQLYYAPMAGELLAAKLLGDEVLVDEVTQAWRLETALVQRCHFVEAGERHMLIPQARAGKPDERNQRGSAINAAMDELLVGLLSVKDSDNEDALMAWRLPVRTPKVGSYSAAVPLLKQAFAAGVDPRRLIGDDSDLARIPERLGWHLKGGAPGDYFAWFDNLGFCYDPLWGCGFVGGEVVLKWDREGAIAFGEELSL